MCPICAASLVLWIAGATTATTGAAAMKSVLKKRSVTHTPARGLDEANFLRIPAGRY